MFIRRIEVIGLLPRKSDQHIYALVYKMFEFQGQILGFVYKD